MLNMSKIHNLNHKITWSTGLLHNSFIKMYISLSGLLYRAPQKPVTSLSTHDIMALSSKQM